MPWVINLEGEGADVQAWFERAVGELRKQKGVTLTHARYRPNHVDLTPAPAPPPAPEPTAAEVPANG